MRRPMIAGNWKMYKTGAEAATYAQTFCAHVTQEHVNALDIVLCAPFTALHEAHAALGSSAIGLGAQDLFWETEGAFTGEISAEMIRATGAQYVIVGHSERRQYFGDTDATVHKKTLAALAGALQPIVCIGEQLDERDAHQTFAVLQRQLAGGLGELTAEHMAALVIAYEPVWAIGTGRNATPEQAQEVHQMIREWLRTAVNAAVADGMRILYGGSVKPANAAALLQQPDVDGALIGGASLQPTDFTAIVEAAYKIQTAQAGQRS
jgi:triosephosphate isomerase (TIM)